MWVMATGVEAGVGLAVPGAGKSVAENSFTEEISRNTLMTD